MWVRFRCGKIVVNKVTVPKSYYWHSETEQLTLIVPDEGVMDEVKVGQEEFDSAYAEATAQDTKRHRGGSYKQKMKQAVAEAAAEQDSEESEEEEELPPPGLSGKEKKKWLKRQERLKRNKDAGGGGGGAADEATEPEPEPEPEPAPEEEDAAAAAADVEKRIGALKRQLKKVELLRSMQMDGEELDESEVEAIKAEHTLRQALLALEKGEQRCFDCGGDGTIGGGKKKKTCSACKG